MFPTIYIIWFLLPLALFGLSGWAVAKPLFGVAGKEDAGDYFKQGLFALFALFLAVLIDKIPFDETLLLLTADSEDLVTIIHWLIYPTVLLVLAQLGTAHRKWKGEDLASRASDGLARYR